MDRLTMLANRARAGTPISYKDIRELIRLGRATRDYVLSGDERSYARMERALKSFELPRRPPGGG